MTGKPESRRLETAFKHKDLLWKALGSGIFRRFEKLL
jgi:hypothetical protein